MNHIMHLKKITERHKAETVKGSEATILEERNSSLLLGEEPGLLLSNEFCCLPGQASY